MDERHDSGEKDISPYLMRPLRSFAEASRDLAATRIQTWRAQTANQNTAIHMVVGKPGTRQGTGG